MRTTFTQNKTSGSMAKLFAEKTRTPARELGNKSYQIRNAENVQRNMEGEESSLDNYFNKKENIPQNTQDALSSGNTKQTCGIKHPDVLCQKLQRNQYDHDGVLSHTGGRRQTAKNEHLAPGQNLQLTRQSLTGQSALDKKNSPQWYLQASSGDKQRQSYLKTSNKMSSEEGDMPFNFSSGGMRKSTLRQTQNREEIPGIHIDDVEERQSVYKNKEGVCRVDRMPEIDALNLQLEQQKRVNRSLENECKRLREQYSKKNIGVFLEDSSRLVNDQQSRSDTFVKALVEKNKKMQVKHQDIATQNVDQKALIKQLTERCNEQDLKRKERSFDARTYEQLKLSNLQLNQESKENRERKKVLQRDYDSAITLFRRQISQEFQTRQTLIDDNHRLRQQIEKMEIKNDHEKDLQIYEYQMEIQIMKNKIKMYEDCEIERDALDAKCIFELQNKEDIKAEYEQFKASSEKVIRDQKDMISKLLGFSNKIEYQNNSMSQQLRNKADQMQAFVQKNLQLESKIAFQEILMSQLKNAEDDVDTLSVRNENRRKLEDANQFVKQQEEKAAVANQETLRFIKEVNDANLCIQKLVQKIKQLETNQIMYKFLEDDIVDSKMGDLLNGMPEKHQIIELFSRLDKEIYQFGMKKVNISLDKQKGLIVNIGGREMSIHDFIGKYAKLELQKWEIVASQMDGSLESDTIMMRVGTIGLLNRQLKWSNQSHVALAHIMTNSKANTVQLSPDNSFMDDEGPYADIIGKIIS